MYIKHDSCDVGWLELRAGLCNTPTLHDEVSVVAVLLDTRNEQNLMYLHADASKGLYPSTLLTLFACL